MNPSSFHKLKITKCIIGNVTLLAPSYYNGLNNPNSQVNSSASAQSIFEGVLQNSKKYFMYCVNDTTTSRRTNVITLTFEVYFSDTTSQAVVLNIPANTFIKVHIPLSIISIPPGETIDSIDLIGVTPGIATILDAFVEAEYQR